MIREDPEMAGLWDRGRPLPQPGEHATFDALLEAKHITRAALARTGCRMVEDAVLMWISPGLAKYRHLETGRRWNSVDPRPTRAHILSAKTPDAEQPTTLLLAEGETDAARLHLLYPFADVALLPLGAEFIPPKLPEQAAEYARVYAAHDADAAGDAGAALVALKVPQAVRLRAADGTDWCDLPPDAEAPPLPEPPDACGSIVFEDFATMLRDGVPDPQQLIADILYDEGVHWVDGEPGCGKTTLCAHWACTLMYQGHHVVWLDFEGGMGPTVRRFAAAGLDADTAAEFFHYSGWPPDAEASLGAVAERWPGALVVFDSASKTLSQAGIDEDNNTEVTRWTTLLVKAAKQKHLPLIVIDHITKNQGAGKSLWSRGAGAKKSDSDVHWRVVTNTPFTREQVGVVTLLRAKDREGFFPLAQWFAIGDGRGGLPVVPCEEPDADEDAVDETAKSPRDYNSF